MPAYIISYDLRQPEQNLENLTAKLSAYPVHWPLQPSIWIVSSRKTATEIRDDLLPCINADDSLFVGKLSGQAAWRGHPEKFSKWIKYLW